MLLQAFRQIQELRKRLKLREQKAEQEADLVVQAKLIRMTDMKVCNTLFAVLAKCACSSTAALRLCTLQPRPIWAVCCTSIAMLCVNGCSTVSETVVRVHTQVPRLADLTLRPNITGKTTGALEAHTNGLRFISIKV
jgi:nucleosome binding factor SPN SPT16 subunit